MKNVRRLAAVALISLFAISGVGCNMITKTEAGIKKSPVAKFDNVTITKGDLDDRMTSVLASFKQQYGDNFMSNSDYKSQYVTQEQQMLDSMITEKIMLKKADDLKLSPTTDAEKTTLTNQEIDTLKKTYTEDQIKQAGFTGGYTDAKFKSYALNLAIMNKVYENVTKDVTVTDAQIKDYYTNNQMEFTEKPDQITLSHILVATQDEANKVEQRLKSGEDFAKVAKEVSTDTGTKDNGGSLGTVPYVNSGLDQTFMNAAIATPAGKVSDPVQTQYGWHVIKVEKKEEYPVKKLDDVKADIKSQLLSQAQQDKYTQAMTQWRTDAKITTYDKNL